MMGTLAKAVLIGLVFVVALLAVVFGMRRVRVPVSQERRGFLARVRTAFYAAAGVILGTSTTCVEGGDDDIGEGRDAGPDGREGRYVDVGPDDTSGPVDYGRSGCYADADGDGDADADDAGDADDADDGKDAPPEVQDSGDEDVGPDDEAEAPPDVEPDAGTMDVVDPDAGSADAFVGLAPEERRRREKWARRTLERAREVRRLLADPGTAPAVREVLRADVRRLRRRVERARRWVRGNNSKKKSAAV